MVLKMKNKELLDAIDDTLELLSVVQLNGSLISYNNMKTVSSLLDQWSRIRKEIEREHKNGNGS
jgi:hypothetical protein